MKETATTPDQFESTYALLVRSEEKQRNRFETAVYSMLIISGIVAVSIFGQQAIRMPGTIVRNTPTVAAQVQHGV